MQRIYKINLNNTYVQVWMKRLEWNRKEIGGAVAEAGGREGGMKVDEGVKDGM